MIQKNAMELSENKNVIALLESDVAEYGCPKCGFLFGNVFVSARFFYDWACRECGAESVVVKDTAIDDKITLLKPAKHPREGIMARENLNDRKPKDGEYFYSRGIGTDKSKGCFVCAGPEDVYNNLSGFVVCIDSARRITNLFVNGAQIRVNKADPIDVRVSVGACDNHLNNLRKLNDTVSRKSIINSVSIRDSVYL